MVAIPKQEGDGVGAVVDALHGHIDLSDAVSDADNQIQRIVSAPFVKRLRRIKQLGFVSQNFLSAQHNRYSHALGTIEIMRKLLANGNVEAMLARSLNVVLELTGDNIFRGSGPQAKSKAIDRLKQHLLVVAAIQDVGELPYENATARTFVPGHAIRTSLRNTAVDLSQMKRKDQFTLHFVWDRSYEQYFGGLNKTLLTYLVSGLVPNGKQEEHGLRALRQLADGHLDADRLDYVYRDAFHTIGIHHTADALIDSIEDYDDTGPILSHVRPITDFIVTRAMLWSNVYLSPENRFRLILLRLALNELRRKPEIFQQFVHWTAEEGLTPDQFLTMDDVFVDNIIRDVAATDVDIERDPFRLLNDGAIDYEYRWVSFAKMPTKDWSGEIAIPEGFYWDTYADYRERNHTLYASGSVRIRGARYSLLSQPINLEDCIGPFCSVLRNATWPALPMPEHMAWFVRRQDWDSKAAAWRTLFKYKDAAQLTTQLEFRDPLKGVTTMLDTRGRSGFKRPRIFLAFAWEEKEILDRVAGVLFDEAREYWALADASKGLGQSPTHNSKTAVDEAEAVIVLASKQYAEKYVTHPDDAIHGEVDRMIDRVARIPIVLLCLDSYRELISNTSFPWKSLSADGKTSYMGAPLKGMSSIDLRDCVLGALKTIDSFNK
jgi:HD superfamily phosphohydrolase